MQNTMLDSTISQNLQDNSSVEYVDPKESPIATVQNSDLIFGQTHNGIECALNPTAKRACDRAWLSAKQVENWSKMSKTTMWRWLERIEKAHRISRVSDMKHVDVLSRGSSQKMCVIASVSVIRVMLWHVWTTTKRMSEKPTPLADHKT